MKITPFSSATELLDRLRAGEVSSRELLESCLQRIERHNPGLNAIVTLDAPRARSRADSADARRAGGGAAGALHGVPATIKDSFETAGLRTTCGAPIYSKHVPAVSADAVQRLEDAGTLVFGKTNVPRSTPAICRATTSFSAPPTIPGMPRAPVVAHRVAPRPRLPPD